MHHPAVLSAKAGYDLTIQDSLIRTRSIPIIATAFAFQLN